MNTKILICFLLLVSPLVAQEPPPRYSGVPFPHLSISSDPFWWTDSRTNQAVHLTAAVGTTTHTNDQGAFAIQINAVRFVQDTKPRQSVVWFSVPVVWFAGKPCDLEVTWWQRTAGSGYFSIYPIYWTGSGFVESNGTPGTGGSDWVKRTMRVPYAGWSEYGLLWEVQANSTTTSRWAQIDAISLNYVIPAGTGNLNTN